MTLGGGAGGLGRGAAARGATEDERRSVPFVACGDLGGYDVDGGLEEGSSDPALGAGAPGSVKVRRAVRRES